MPTNITGLLGNTQNFLGQLGGLASAWDNLQSNINPVTGQSYDVTAPGVVTTETSGALGQATAPLIPGILGAAQNIYDAGRPDLNPLLQGAYNQAAPVAARQATATGAGLDVLQNVATGADPYTQQLAQQSATAAGSPFAQSGTYGSARHQAAANKAAADAISERQVQAARALPYASQALGQSPGTLADYGQSYQDWQTGADFDWLGQYQDATAFGQDVPSTATAITAPSGADIASALRANDGSSTVGGGTSPQYGSGVAGQIDQFGNIVGGVSNLIDIGGGIWDTVSGWFAEGGEIPTGNSMGPSPRYMKAKQKRMMKQGG